MSAAAAIPTEVKRRNNFMLIPNMADDDLNIYEFRLLGHYTRICGQEGGRCWQGIKTIHEKTGISLGMITKTRNSLEAKGFISVSVPDGKSRNRGESISVSIVDRWQENTVRYCKESESADSENDDNVIPYSEIAVSPGETNKIYINQEPEKEKEKKTDKALLANPEPVAPEPVAVSSVFQIPENSDEIFLGSPHGEPGDEQWQPPEARSIFFFKAKQPESASIPKPAASILSTNLEASSTNQQHIAASSLPVEDGQLTAPPGSAPPPIVPPETTLKHNDLTFDDRIIPGLKPGDKPLYKPDDVWKRVQKAFDAAIGGTMGGALQSGIEDGLELRGVEEVVKLIERAKDANSNPTGMLIKAFKNWRNEPVPGGGKDKSGTGKREIDRWFLDHAKG